MQRLTLSQAFVKNTAEGTGVLSEELINSAGQRLKEAQRAKLEADVEAFLSRGGQIREVPSGYSAFNAGLSLIVDNATR